MKSRNLCERLRCRNRFAWVVQLSSSKRSKRGIRLRLCDVHVQTYRDMPAVVIIRRETAEAAS